MGGRAFDPAMLDFVDSCTLGEDQEDELEDFTLVESCPVCGAPDLVREHDDTLVDLFGVVHQCPERS